MRKHKATKGLVSIAATMTLATSFATSASAATHTVEYGDSLWKIANSYNTSVSKLQSINDISGHLIYPGQKIETEEAASSSTSTSAHTYTVKGGDTLWGIGRNFDVSIRDLKEWNNLSSDLILIGQKLTVKSSVTVKSSSTQVKSVSVSNEDNGYAIVNEAKKHIGTPYVWGGSRPGGFDCSGFIAYVLNETGNDIVRTTSAGYYNMAAKTSSPEIGDIVFFAGTYKPGISHMGFYIGNNSFIHSANDGVEITSLDNSYWSRHFVGFGSL